MDFIEQIFGLAPDGGSGTLEFLLFAIPVVILGVLQAARSSRRKHRN